MGTALHAYLRSSSCQLDTERSVSYCWCKNAARRIHWRDYIKPSGNAMHSTLSVQFSKIINIHHWAVTAFAKKFAADRHSPSNGLLECIIHLPMYNMYRFFKIKIHTINTNECLEYLLSVTLACSPLSSPWIYIVAPLSSLIDLNKGWNYIFELH